MSFITRRRIFAYLAASTSSVAFSRSGGSLSTLLLSDSGEERAWKILAKHFPLNASDRPLISEFYKSLLRAENHTENHRFFAETLHRQALEERLEKYLIEEFIGNTNYLLVHEKQALRLELI
ncbi:MAG: hypothetical protein H7318_18300 [Oligoflexus sp.]|nr:hypothetical protein [Oligoflexus sp.]